jgi:hypothetical protein
MGFVIPDCADTRIRKSIAIGNVGFELDEAENSKQAFPF